MTAPKGLAVGGRKLWREVSELHELDETQRVQLLEACRAKDRLDKLDGLLRGEVSAWVSVKAENGEQVVVIDKALAAANSTANLLKQLLAALRLPDEATGKRPQRRSARGAYKARAGASKDRLRAV